MELYSEDLDRISRALEAFENLVADVQQLFEVELRFRLDDTLDWVVVGFGESGDPCVLRFEKEPAPVVTLKPLTPTTTFNKPDHPPMKDYDTRF